MSTGLAPLALVLLVSCAPTPAEVPAELLGKWTTAAGGFDGRAMIFALDTVTFETGEEPASHHRVLAVETSDAGEGRIDLVYEGEGGNDYRLALLYDAARETLRLVNRDDVSWTRGGAR